MCRMFVNCNRPLVNKLRSLSGTGNVVNMETEFCSVALDIIGKAVFNYEFGSVTKESPVIQAVYSTLKEVCARISSYHLWRLPITDRFYKIG